MIMSPEFVIEEPCLPSILVDTTLLWGCADYWSGMLLKIDRLKYSHIRPLGEYDMARIANSMNRTSVFRINETTYSSLPFIMKLSPS